MARPTKTPFTIYADTGIPTPDSAYQPSFDDAVKAQLARTDSENEEGHGDGFVTESDDGGLEHSDDGRERGYGLQGFQEDDIQEADDERRASQFTRTSISSMPESTYPIDAEAYRPPLIRPSFRRPESVRRMQMTSPPPFSRNSPRRSVLRGSRSRAGTPKSVRADAQGSPRPRRQVQEETQEAEAEHYPLVLLHVTLLPVELPWSAESIHELLSKPTLDNLQLLRSKVSDTVLKRGLLIPHPRGEYEMLEERLLEALELKQERVTKCGHFRGRDSVGSLTSSNDSDRESDSGLGSSLDGSDTEVCTTCHHAVSTSASKVTGAKRKWSVKVFAANGLMRAPAWSAAWPEMERVDIEISPWISDDLRRKLDERQERETADEAARAEDENERIRELVEEQVRLAHEESMRVEEAERNYVIVNEVAQRKQKRGSPSITIPETAIPGRLEASKSQQAKPASQPQQDLPQIYRPSQIPTSVLLKNYLYLLAQDRRNVAIFFLGLIALFFALRPTHVIRPTTVKDLSDVCASYTPATLTTTMTNISLDVAAELEAAITHHAKAVQTESTSAPLLESSEQASDSIMASAPLEQSEVTGMSVAQSVLDVGMAVFEDFELVESLADGA